MGKNKLTYTVEEAAELLGISRSSTYEAVRNGSVPALRIGGRWLISKVQQVLSWYSKPSRASRGKSLV